MAEDTRLKNRLNVETQLNSQSLQPQNPPQTIHAEKLFKEAEDYNNIDDTIMAHSHQIVLDYLLFRLSFIIPKRVR